MLKKLTIRNFKAIQDMTIEFTPLTVLIGGNSCGKSTVLQALDFLRSSALRDIPEYMREKGWKIEEIKSQLNDGKNKPIEFISVYEFIINKKKQLISWHIQIDKEKYNWLLKEKIENLSTKEEIYSRGFGKNGIIMAGHSDAYAGNPNAVAHDINEINLQASWLKYFYTNDEKPMLSSLRDYLAESVFFGLLSPDSIRKGDGQTVVDNIGINGTTLAAFIHNLSIDDRKQLDKTVSKLVDFTLKINTADVGKKIELYIDEEFGASSTRINKEHISDGLLRIMAFVAISLQKKKNYNIENSEKKQGFILLDEIEDGINPYLASKITKLLKNVTKDTHRQVIVTTHSPIILNEFMQEEIVIMWKNRNGSILNEKMFATNEMKILLEALNPGEVWINLEKKDILKRLSTKKEGKE
jgi:predicted ATPase